MIAQPAHKFCGFAVAITVLGMAGGCSSQPSHERSQPSVTRPVSAPQTHPVEVGERAARVALQQVGTPYRSGGNTGTGFDCSGLVQFSYSRAGKAIPRTTGQQWSTTRPVSRGELQKGDLLFFNIAGKMSHVGLYIGGQNSCMHRPAAERLRLNHWRHRFTRALLSVQVARSNLARRFPRL